MAELMSDRVSEPVIVLQLVRILLILEFRGDLGYI
jgi:hypothetical protein